MELIVENIPIPQIRGRRPSSIEHKLGLDIWMALKEKGNSVFIPFLGEYSEIDLKSLSIRLTRLSKGLDDKEVRDFSIIKESRCKKAYGEIIEEQGFRVFRTK